MGSEYHLTEKGRRNEPKNPAGKAILEYIKEGHNPIVADEVKQMVPGVASPEGELDSLARAGFLEKEGGGSSSGHYELRSNL